jgi:hypothetical protein
MTSRSIPHWLGVQSGGSAGPGQFEHHHDPLSPDDPVGEKPTAGSKGHRPGIVADPSELKAHAGLGRVDRRTAVTPATKPTSMGGASPSCWRTRWVTTTSYVATVPARPRPHPTRRPRSDHPDGCAQPERATRQAARLRAWAARSVSALPRSCRQHTRASGLVHRDPACLLRRCGGSRRPGHRWPPCRAGRRRRPPAAWSGPPA